MDVDLGLKEARGLAVVSIRLALGQTTRDSLWHLVPPHLSLTLLSYFNEFCVDDSNQEGRKVRLSMVVVYGCHYYLPL